MPNNKTLNIAILKNIFFVPGIVRTPNVHNNSKLFLINFKIIVEYLCNMKFNMFVAIRKVRTVRF